MPNSICIIDDEPTDRTIARRLLRRWGVEAQVHEFSDGDEALAFFEDAERLNDECGPFPPPAVLLLDIKMPRMGGFEFLERIEQLVDRGALDRKSLRVLLCTSSSNPKDRARADAVSVVQKYLVKPLRSEDAEQIKTMFAVSAGR